MAVEIKFHEQTDDFIVLAVFATTSGGVELPEKRISLAKAALADGTITVASVKANAEEKAQQAILNYEAAEAALRELL